MGQKFSGYKMAVCAVLICAGGVGFTYYTLSLYLPSWVAEFGVSLAEGSITFSIVGITTMLGSFASSALVSRAGLKRLYALGVASLVAGYLLLLFSNGIALLYVSGALIGLGVAWAGMIPLGTIVPNWFIERQGLMMGLVAGSMGIDGFIANLLFSNLITNLGWRPCALITAIIVLACCVPALIMVKPNPQDIGQLPLGATEQAGKSDNIDSQRAYRQARKTSSFVLLCVLVFCISSLITGMVPQVASVVTSNGFDLVFAGTVSGIMQIANVCGAFLMGIINDKLKLKGVFIYCLVMGAVSMACIFFTASVGGCLAFAVAFGLAQSMLTTAYPLFIGPVFGSEASEQIVGFFNGVSGVGEAIMPSVVGFLVTLAGSYNAAAVMEIAIIAIGVVCGFVALKKAPLKKSN